MAILIGTDAGLQRTDFKDNPRMLDFDGRVFQLHMSAQGVLAATDQGVYRVPGDEQAPESLGLESNEVSAIHETPHGALIAGTRPAHVYRSSDGGSTWNRLHAFEELPGKSEWTQNYMGPARVRDFASHPAAPSSLYVAVETAGVYVTPDAGETWVDRSRGLDNDPHGVTVVGREDLIATCGRGLYRSENGGQRWYRLDTHHDFFWYQYFRSGIQHKGRFYTSAMDRSTYRHRDETEGVLLATTDWGESLTEQSFPGQDEDFVNAWTVVGDRVIGGTVGGRILRGTGEWEVVCRVDGPVRSLVALED